MSGPLQKAKLEGECFFDFISKAEDPRAASNDKSDEGRKSHPYNYARLREFKNLNIHHSTCIDVKKACTVGMGFRTESDLKRKYEAEKSMADPMHTPQVEPPEKSDEPSVVDEAFDELCDVSFQQLLDDAVEDYWECGWGGIEVVREDEDDRAPMIGLHHLNILCTEKVWEPDGINWHWLQRSDDGKERVFARFGDLEGFRERLRSSEAITDSDAAENLGESDIINELIYLPMSSNKSNWYGVPEYLAAIGDMELQEAVTQKQHDFYHNRGVPELLMSILGVELPDTYMEKLRQKLSGLSGLGQNFKNMLLNIGEKEVQVNVEKLASDVDQHEEYSDMTATTAAQIVSAHGVPPLLANIQIPGKMGATNELPNALLAFQLLKIGPAQKQITSILRKTLGNSEKNGGLQIQPKDLVLRKITDFFDIGKADTISRMRTPVTQAQAEGRKPESGLKD